ncbi:sulfatase-like hydrolase/transferase [Candidatus Poribacteria bacterium]|nr:sulfatase-like hydrolase/transferase [Candidatus Poribacteria bacterium]
MRIVFFDIDCLRPDHLGCYGYNRPTSPAIDSIAEQGVRFGHYYCGSSPCLPSRTAWSSGRFGIRNGVISNHGAGAKFHIRTRNYGGPQPENEMLMRQLRRHGYDTISFSNFADRHNALWFMYGWSEYHTPNLKGGAETAEEVNEKVIPWLKQNATRDNYLLHINYWDAHRCYKMNESWADRFKDFPVEQEWPDEDEVKTLMEIKGPFTATGQFGDKKSPFPLMPDTVSSRKDFEHMITGYDASIAYVDHYVKMVLDELESQGVLEDTAIIISADHGDAFGEHGIYSDHVCADECIHRIPLIIKWPGVSAVDIQDDSFLYNVDLPATLCDLLNIPDPEDWDGSSFKENMKGNNGLDRDYLVWDHGLYTVQRAVRTKTHLMIRTYDSFNYPFEPVELYDMVNDPYQTENIRDKQPEIVTNCDHYLAEWIHQQRAKGHCIPDPAQEILRERSK